jgi:YHS domain-containing protein
MGTTVTDPVCGMEVRPHQNEVIYLDIAYAFCSQQCQQRFLASPHLYVGAPGQPAAKEQGKTLMKSRRIHLGASLTPGESEDLSRGLREMTGVVRVTVEGDHVEIVYDLSQATAEQIELKLVELGTRMGSGWAERLRRSFVHYEEECELGNMEADERHRRHP